MPYNANSMNNLHPFTGKDDPNRQNGRKKGSKNIKTLTRRLLESDINLSLPINDEMKTYLSSNGNHSYMEAITLTMIVKAVNGDTSAASLIFNRSEKLGIDEEESHFPKLDFGLNPDIFGES